MLVSFHMNKSAYTYLKSVAHRKGLSTSQAIRDAIRLWLQHNAAVVDEIQDEPSVEEILTYFPPQRISRG